MSLRKGLVALISTSEFISLDGVRNQPSPYSGITDNEGHFRIEGIQPGEYRVTLQRNGFVATNHRSRIYSSTLISLSAGQDTSGLLFRMQPAGVIQGKIVDEDGDPVPAVNVFAVSPATPGAPANGTTNDRGEYRIAGLTRGEYFVMAEPAQEMVLSAPKPDARVYAPTFYPGTMDRREAAKIDVHPGDEASANFNLVSTRTFRVRGIISGFAGLKSQSGSQPGISTVTLQSADDWVASWQTERSKSAVFSPDRIGPVSRLRTAVSGRLFVPARLSKFAPPTLTESNCRQSRRARCAAAFAWTITRSRAGRG